MPNNDWHNTHTYPPPADEPIEWLAPTGDLVRGTYRGRRYKPYAWVADDDELRRRGTKYQPHYWRVQNTEKPLLVRSQTTQADKLHDIARRRELET